MTENEMADILEKFMDHLDGLDMTEFVPKSWFPQGVKGLLPAHSEDAPCVPVEWGKSIWELHEDEILREFLEFNRNMDRMMMDRIKGREGKAVQNVP